MLKTMISIKDIGETIKAGDQVKVGTRIIGDHLVSEYLKGWYEYSDHEERWVVDQNKIVIHRFSNEELFKTFRELTDEEKIIGKCAYCEKMISMGDRFLENGKQDIYCEECVEEHTVTTFYLGGEEYIGSENDGWIMHTKN